MGKMETAGQQTHRPLLPQKGYLIRPVSLLPLLIALLTVGCADINPGPPPVEAERLARVVADLTIAQSLVAQVPILVRDSMQTVYYENVLADHGLTRPEFDSLMWIVRSEPAWIDSIYTHAGSLVSREMLE